MSLALAEPEGPKEDRFVDVSNSCLVRAHKGAANYLDSNAKGDFIVTAGDDGNIGCFSFVPDEKNGLSLLTTIEKAHLEECSKVRLDSALLNVISCGFDCRLCVTDLETGKPVWSYLWETIVTSCDYQRSDDNIFYAATDLDFNYWKFDKRQQKPILKKHIHETTVTSLNCITGDRAVSTDLHGYIKVFDLKSSIVTISRKDQLSATSESCISKDGRTLAVASWDKTICLYDLEVGNFRKNGPCVLPAQHTNSVSTIDFGQDGNSLISGGYDGVCYVWSMSSEKPRQRLQIPDSRAWISCVRSAPDASYAKRWVFFTCRDGSLRAWNELGGGNSKVNVRLKAIGADTLTCEKCGRVFPLSASEQQEASDISQTGDTFDLPEFMRLCVFCRLSHHSHPSVSTLDESVMFRRPSFSRGRCPCPLVAEDDEEGHSHHHEHGHGHGHAH